MCNLCEHRARADRKSATRRGFLKVAGISVLGIAAHGTGFAAPPMDPPKAENVLSSDAALDRLLVGNERYVEGVTRRHDFKNEREALTKGQNPYAAILSCADSRIAPEYAFDAGRGDLFVCRVAGNLLNDDTVASFEYAVSVLNTPLILVLGHQGCGAVDAAIKSVKSGSTLPGHLPSLVAALTPAVKAVLDQPGDTLNNAIKQNVVLTVAALKSTTPILNKAVDERKIRVVGAIYDLATGRVAVVT